MAEYGITELGSIEHKSISLRSEAPRTMPILLKAAQGELKAGTLLQKVGVTTFSAVVGVGGIDDQVSTTTIPLKSNTGAIADGTVIRIGDEIIIVGTYDSGGNQLTGCTRGAWGTTPAAAVEDAEISIVKDVEQYEVYNALKPVEGYLAGDVDTGDSGSTPLDGILVFDDDVDRNSLIAATDVPIPEGFDSNSLINFKESK